jgi:hypothetical protein
MMLVPLKSRQEYILYVHSVNSSQGDICYNRLFNLYQEIAQIPDERLKIIIDFHYCEFLDHLGVAFLGGIVRSIKNRQGQLEFDLQTISKPIYMNLAQNGFLHECGENLQPWQGNSVRYRCDLALDESIYQYLEEQWLGQDWIDISPDLREGILSTVAEIYLNAFDHSQSAIGVFSCGQHYPKKEMLELTTIDFGVGIISNVRSLPQYTEISTEEALKWAFEPGNSTKQQELSRGNGLKLLQDFVIKNQGSLRVCTNDGQVIVSDNGVIYNSTKNPFSGTLVNIAFRCDNSN